MRIRYEFLLTDTTYHGLEEDILSIAGLLNQLSDTPRKFSYAEHGQLSPGIRVAVARDEPNPDKLGKLVGMATLVPMTVLGRRKGTIEDVVVLEEYQGRGIGSQLIKKLSDEAQRLKLEYLDLTSTPERGTAIRLYTQAGFKRRETGIFRLTF